jgi:hydrogenase small subunit
MMISRRQFLELCRNFAPALGLTAVELTRLEKLLANPNAPSVVWLQGSACTGCSVSLMHRISATRPADIADVLINFINLRYHPNVMGLAGEPAAAIAEEYRTKGKTAPQILCVGTCAAWGGIPAAAPNPTGVRAVSAITGRPKLNIAGCPPHPDWIVWAIANLLLGTVAGVDGYGRPTALFNRTVHRQCPRRETEEASTYGQDLRCLEELGCRAPDTIAPCPTSLWNNRQNWRCDSNTLCIGCTSPTFPGRSLRRNSDGDDD